MAAADRPHPSVPLVGRCSPCTPGARRPHRAGEHGPLARSSSGRVRAAVAAQRACGQSSTFGPESDRNADHNADYFLFLSGRTAQRPPQDRGACRCAISWRRDQPRLVPGVRGDRARRDAVPVPGRWLRGADHLPCRDPAPTVGGAVMSSERACALLCTGAIHIPDLVVADVEGSHGELHRIERIGEQWVCSCRGFALPAHVCASQRDPPADQAAAGERSISVIGAWHGRAVHGATEPLGPHGGDHRDQVGITNLVANTDDYVIARLKRDDPGLAAEVIEGRITAHAAARHGAAGHGWARPGRAGMAWSGWAGCGWAWARLVVAGQARSGRSAAIEVRGLDAHRPPRGGRTPGGAGGTTHTTHEESTHAQDTGR